MDASEEEVDKELFMMALIVPEQSQRPYRFGMTLLCIGALFNWLGLADSYTEPVPAVRYIGVGLIAVGAALICLAMCCWMWAVQDPQYAREMHNRESVAVQVISTQEPDPRTLEKPPDYSSVVDFPPSYEDAIKELDANKLLYACPLQNNNYQEVKLEDVLIISQLAVHSNQTDNRTRDSKAANTEDSGQTKEEVTKETFKTETDNAFERRTNEWTEPQHTIVEISCDKVRSQRSDAANSTHSSVHKPHECKANLNTNLAQNVANLASNSANLVNADSKPLSISNVLRKSFRSLRKSATLPAFPSMTESDCCDSETPSDKQR